MKNLVKLFIGFVIILCMSATDAYAAKYILHLNGMCTQQWTDGNSRLANAPGYISVNCVVDNKVSIANSASQFKTKYLDVYCNGGDWCYILNYSMGDAIVGYINANYPPNWNIAYIYTTAGAGGGSELAIKGISSIFTCGAANDLGVSTVRNKYNHNDTNGISIYHIGGYKGIFGASLILPGEDDGVVAYHSAGACVNSGSYKNLCSCTHWANHKIAYSCTGYYLNHSGMKMKFIYLKGW